MVVESWILDRVEKYKTFLADDAPGALLIQLATWEMGLQLGPEGKPLDAWDLPTEAAAFAAHQAASAQAQGAFLRDFGDDTIPTVFAGVGIAPNTLFCTHGEYIAGESTTWTHSVLRELQQVEELELTPENIWVQAIKTMCQTLVQQSDGNYAVQSFSHFSPLDLANGLRGNDLFIDFFDDPEGIQKLMDFCTEAVIFLEKELRPHVPMVAGGTPIWGTWTEGRTVFCSEDLADLCSPATYVEFAQPCTQKVFDAFDGGWIHHHAKGLHVHGEIAKLNGLRYLQISQDPNCPKPIDHIEELYEQNGGTPLVLGCSAEDVYAHIDQLMQGRCVLVLSGKTLDEVREAMRFIRRHSRL